MKITIVDYGMGNLRSVAKACEACGAEPSLATEAAAVGAADRLILPGVGSFKDAMGALERQGLVDPLRDYLRSGRPFLGICLGLHLLFEYGEEGGGREGLGFVPGRVVHFAEPDRGSEVRLPIPHMGWNQIEIERETPLLAGIPSGAYLYFLHSYHVVPTVPEEVTLTRTRYPEPFCSSVALGNVYATQFHPEKSQQLGLRILSNFLDLDTT